MAGPRATLGSERRISDFISLGVIAKTLPIAKVHDVLVLLSHNPILQIRRV